jgi:exopolysaccharide biosynthesis polyprenyl glycosylphosphotransferase
MIAPVLGGVSELESILMRLPVDEVMVALPIKSHFGEIEEIVGVCGRAGIQTQYSLELFTSDVAKHHSVDSAEGTRVVVEMVHSDHRLVLKSTLDRIAATLGLIALSPVFVLIGLAVKLTSKGPVFFVQQRFGLGKRKFGMIKFRTMVVDAEARQASLEHLNEHNGPTFKMKSDPRITRLGSFLRRSSLDELPQLINVLKGEMSLVGPRPLPSRDVERFSAAWLMRRFSVKPGITGLWQVSGRSNTDFDNAIKLDLRYIDKWSLLLDVKILFRTLSAVAKGRGAY